MNKQKNIINKKYAVEVLLTGNLQKRKYNKTNVGVAVFGDPQKGITLIALVITIIVLIILAGVSINLIFNENGIISKAKQAKAEYENAQAEQQKQIGKLEDYINSGIGQARVNEPDINKFNKEVTYYVTWTGSETDTPTETALTGTQPENWYNYSIGVKKWANIKTINGGNDAYWVWIPRYAYKVPTRSSTAQTIEIKFLEGTSNVPTDGTNITISNNTTPGSWNVHPAFNFGGTQLTGIWVAKFEASSSNPQEGATYGGGNTTDLQVRVVPKVTSWRVIQVTNIFTVCRKMGQAGGTLGLTNIDTHMMKNSEWGAVAYLTQSIYGNAQTDGTTGVWNNSYYEGDAVYSGSAGSYGGYRYYGTTKTGMVGVREGTTNGRDNYSNYYSVSTNKTENAEEGTVTISYNAYVEENTNKNAPTSTYTNTYYEYWTKIGQKGSTTGNVYGIYDMAGGAWEYTAGYLNEVLANDVTRQGYSQSLYDADAKYKDVYAGSSENRQTNYEANTNKYGDGVYETSTAGTGATSWNTDYSDFPSSTYPVFERGGDFHHSSSAGVFAFSNYSGSTYLSIGFRPVLVFP